MCHGPTKANATASAQRIAAALAAPFARADTQITLRASIGIACSQFGLAAEELIARADAAMYQSKRAGQGQPVRL
ncbi:MAG: diguanylate cyclase domain-containing protein [Solirubrobacteraceae bacterium]